MVTKVMVPLEGLVNMTTKMLLSLSWVDSKTHAYATLMNSRVVGFCWNYPSKNSSLDCWGWYAVIGLIGLCPRSYRVKHSTR